MGYIADQVDNFKAGFKLIDRFMHWAASSPAKRLFVLSLIGAIIIGAYYWYTHSLLTEYQEGSEDVQERIDLVLKQNLYQTTIDWANMCISSRKEKLENVDWYCEQALELYKVRSESTPPVLRESIISRKAYGAMVVDMSSQLRGIDIERLYMRRSNESLKILEMLTSTTGMLFTLAGIMFLMSVTAMYLFLYAGRNSYNLQDGTTQESSDA